MAVKEFAPLSREDYGRLQSQMESTPDPDTIYTEWGAHPELSELLRQFGYLATSRYEAYEIGVKLLEMGESMAWKEKTKLGSSNWHELDNMMRDGVDPNETYTATGWHFDLNSMLQSFGYRPTGRNDTWNLAKELWEMGPREN